jgi:hypothetical protein
MAGQENRGKTTADPSTRPGTPGLAQDDIRFLIAQDGKFMVMRTSDPPHQQLKADG